jgi:hypothetical protein
LEELENTTGAHNSTKESDLMFPDTHRVQKCAVTVSDENGCEYVPLPKERIAVTTSQISKPPTVSERKLQANRANAKKSTGPRTARGKARSRRNAVRHCLTSRIVMFDPQGRLSCSPFQKFCSRSWQAKRIKLTRFCTPSWWSTRINTLPRWSKRTSYRTPSITPVPP